MNQQTLEITIHITPTQAGTYFTIPFDVPQGIESLELSYQYDRRPTIDYPLPAGVFHSRVETNIIDLGLICPDGSQVGASGSDKTEIHISETAATPGYQPVAIHPGQWGILVGAYKVAPQGVGVRYQIRMTPKSMRLLRGELHAHTLASDGVHTPEELAIKARRNGLDFVSVTDHNQMISKNSLPQITGVTMIPGIEWTHYQGHANFLGVDRPYDSPFATNTFEETRELFESARQRGALIMINHPFDPACGFQFDLNLLPHDVIEVWNGPMRESNLKAVGYWHQLLSSGKKIPMCGGSDYHRDTPFIFLGGPTMGVYALSAGISDILSAVRDGHGFVTFAPDGPTLEMTAGEAIMGDTVQWKEIRAAHIRAWGLLQGDVVRAVTASHNEVLFQAQADGDITLDFDMAAPGFLRVEILRAFLPGLPMLPALLSNPIYFDA